MVGEPSTLIKPIVASESKRPVASGLISPLSRRAGPSPRKISRLVPAKLFPEKATSPSIVTKSPILSERSETESSNTLPSASPNSIPIVRPAIVTSSDTAAPVVLILKVTVPPASTGPTDKSASPETIPATPAVPLTKTRAPSPFCRVTSSPLKSTVAEKLVTPILVTVEPSSRVICSNTTFAVAPIITPSTSKVSEAPVISTRRNGPAGKSRTIGAAPISKVSNTALDVVLIEIVAVKFPVSMSATLTATVPLNSPATPCAVMTKAPLPPLRVTKPLPMSMATSWAASLTTVSLLVASVSCSKKNTPETV